MEQKPNTIMQTDPKNRPLNENEAPCRGQPGRQPPRAEHEIRINFHMECEGLINRQINMELYASYVYLALAYHFDRYDVALQGHAAYFREMAEEENEHAQKFMHYQNKRGGTIVLLDIQKPAAQSWESPLEAHETALQLEKDVYNSLLELHAFGCKHNDPHLTNYLEEEFLDEQVKSIKEYGEYITNLKRVGPGLGEYIFDREEFHGSTRGGNAAQEAGGKPAGGAVAKVAGALGL